MIASVKLLWLFEVSDVIFGCRICKFVMSGIRWLLWIVVLEKEL